MIKEPKTVQSLWISMRVRDEMNKRKGDRSLNEYTNHLIEMALRQEEQNENENTRTLSGLQSSATNQISSPVREMRSTSGISSSSDSSSNCISAETPTTTSAAEGGVPHIV